MPRPKGLPKTGGKKKGSKHKTTIDKEIQREIVRQTVAPALVPMLEAHIAHAQGLSKLVIRARDGKFKPVTDADDIAKATEIWLQAPNPQSLTILLDRLLDRAKEQEQELKLTGDADLIAKLLIGRKRASQGSRGPVQK